MTTSRPTYEPHLDGLRAVAVGAVLCFHAFPTLLPGGFVGVDVFFVISGFLITRILLADFAAPAARLPGVIGRFYARRIRRIFPALCLVLAACLVAAFFLLFPSDLQALGRSAAAAAGFGLNLVLAQSEGYFAAESASNPLLHLWSLGVEEQFYLIWPLVLWLCLRLRRRVLPAVIFLAASSYFWNGLKFAPHVAAAFYLPHDRLWELALGAAAAALGAEGTRPATRLWRAGSQVASVAGLGLILAGFILIRDPEGYPNAWALLPTGGALLVVLSAGSAMANRWLLARPALVGIGLISYPLYLWHWPLLAFAQLTAESSLSVAERGAILAVSLLLAWLTYRFVEQPVRRAKRTGLAAGLLVLLAVAVAAFGWTAYRHEGFPGRFSPALRAIASYRYVLEPDFRLGKYFLIGDQDASAFRPEPAEHNGAKPTLYLWGDSYAASLYPGLRKVYAGKYNILQRTAAMTPPFAPGAFGPGNAQNISRFVLDEIGHLHPDLVIVAGRWRSYDLRKLRESLAILHGFGLKRVVVVGSEPEWIGGLPHQAYRYAFKHPNAGLPQRLKTGRNLAALAGEPELKAIAEGAGARYLSPIPVFENADGTLIRTGPGIDSLVSYDVGHLTRSGSIYLIEHLPPF